MCGGGTGGGASAELHQHGRRRGHAATSTRIASASWPPRTCTASPKEANSGPPNGCFSMTSKRVAGRDPALGQVAQHRRVGVRDAHERAGRAGLERGQGERRRLLDHEVARRDGIAVRVVRRVAELGRDQVLELVGEDVLEHLGLRVHAVPRDPEVLGQVELQQPVVADDLQRHLLPTLGQPHALVGLVRDQLELAQLAHHPRRGGGGDPEALGDGGGRDRVGAGRLEGVDRLRVVLDRGGDGRVTHWHDSDYGTPKP